MATDGSPEPSDSARLFEGRTVPILLGIGLMIAGLSLLFAIVPQVAFGVLLILSGALLFNSYS
jgi:hypothetical protein